MKSRVTSDTAELRDRSPEAVLRDHLALRDADDLESDTTRNNATSVAMICGDRTYRGHDGVRASAADLDKDLPDGRFDYCTVRTEQEIGFLEWTGTNEHAAIDPHPDRSLHRQP
jgi:hypothetical protein